MPGLEVAYENFLDRVEEETLDPEWNIFNHPARRILDNYSPVFCDWVRHLVEILCLKKAGFPYLKEDFSHLEWKCLWILECWETKKEILDPSRDFFGNWR